MTVIPLDTADAKHWNEFIVENFPPVGAFLQSWQWGDFKQQLFGTVKRYAVTEGNAWVGCFQMEIHALPFKLAYGYAPRGPVLRADLWNDEQKVAAAFSAINTQLKKDFPELVFMRFEPPHQTRFAAYESSGFSWLPHYIQPRFNQLITVLPEEKLVKTFSRDVRHDIHAADRLNITVDCKETLTPEEAAAFEKMKDDTCKRSNKNVYPSENYFTHFLETFSQPKQKERPYVRYFIARRDGEPVAIHMSLFFADTLTYLYGASYSGPSSKRAPAYLHWKSMLYARDFGYQYYDLGGVDSALWQGLTYFKRQFGGQTLEYVGTFDRIMRPVTYLIYTIAKDSRKALGEGVY